MTASPVIGPSPLDGGRLRRRIAAGEATLGTFVGTASAVTAEVCASTGVDWLLLDLEHGAGGEEQLRSVVLAGASYGVPTIVRVETATRIRIGRVLDLGAAGVMLPRLDSAAEVAQALNHLYYAPYGDRGVATYTRACRFGRDLAALDRSSDEILGVVQIESKAALDEVDRIAGLPGADVLFVGPRDLSHDLGVPGEVTSPRFIAALDKVLNAARSNNKACGLLVGDGVAAAARLAEGWTFVAIGSDSTLLAAALAGHLNSARTNQ